MSKDKFPVTQAIRALRAAKVPFTEHLYVYEEKGGTRASARELGVDEHCVIKTLIMQDEQKKPLVVLMHGDREVGTGMLAKQIGAKKIEPCAPEVANKHSGYLVGGTSPFGTKQAMPVYMEASILELPQIFLNGGKRGFQVCVAPADAQRLLNATLVHAAAS
jgi:Cys-tRNA(Pro) deacylase